MKISIVIPTRNRPHALGQCLAALRQSIGSAAGWEILVVDDASQPKLAAENQALCARHGARYMALKRNRGMSVGRGRGVAASTGAWAAFLDDDVVVAGDWYGRLMQQIDACDDLTVGIEGFVAPSGNGVWDSEVQNLSGGLYLTCHIVYRLQALRDAGSFDERFEHEGPFHEDHELACRMLLLGRIVFDPKLRATHSPRRVKCMSYLAGSVQRMRQLLNAEIYFFLKHRDRYHLFRHAKSFWGTYRAIALRHVYTNFHRRTLAVLLRHPVEAMTLALSSLIEQATAWAMFALLLQRYLCEVVPAMEKIVNWPATAQRWGLKTESARLALRLDRPLLSLARFALTRKPVYDQIPVLQRVSACCAARPRLRIFLRIDDVFFDDSRAFEQFVNCMCGLQAPFLAAVTANDLTSPHAAGNVRALGGAKAAIGVHGFEHAGRFGPFASEVLQMSLPQIGGRLSETLAKTKSYACRPVAFVAPYNAINAAQICFVSGFLPIVCGGPETARFTERLTGPLVLSHGGLYFPSFFPFYSSSDIVRQEIEKHSASLLGDICITLHMRQEQHNAFDGLGRLAEAIGDTIRPWDELLPPGRGGA